MQAERQQGQADVLPWCGTRPDLGPVLGVWRRGQSCWPHGQARVERKTHCWQHSTGGEGGDGECVDGRWHVVSLWESLTVAGEVTAVGEEARFLREPFCWTTLLFKPGFGLFVFGTPCNLCCTEHVAMLRPPSGAGQSPVKVAVRGSWPSLTGALMLALVR